MFNFILLPGEGQAQHLLESGRYLGNRSLGVYQINLYSVEDFFVEVWYNKDEDTVYAITPFKDSTRLEPFVENIDLEVLISIN